MEKVIESFSRLKKKFIKENPGVWETNYDEIYITNEKKIL